MSIFNRHEAAINRFLNGWGFVEGRWVYVPLWDPTPEEGKFLGYRALYTANALLNLSKLVIVPETAIRLRGMAKELAGSVSGDLVGDWDDGDICPSFPHHHFGGGGGGNPEPDPVYFDDHMSAELKNDIAAHLIQRLGEMTGNLKISKVGQGVMLKQQQ